jgi:flagellar hook-associated protein 3 FlgL
MRITNKVLSNNMLRNMFQTMGGMDKYQNMATTGRKINRPSDNPSGNITTLRMRTKLAQNEQFKDNATTAKSWLEKSEDSLISMGEIMQRVRELAVKGANGTNDEGALKATAEEVDQLLDEMKVLANSQNSDRYIFGGTNTDREIYDGTTWDGNSQVMQVEIGEGITIDLNLDGKKIFGIDDTVGYENSVFATLKNFSDNLKNGDFDGISSDIGIIDGHINTILSARSEIGAKSNRIDMTMSRLDAAELSYTKVLSDTEDADMAEVIIRLKEQENVYNATLAAGARIIQPTLVDFLR